MHKFHEMKDKNWQITCPVLKGQMLMNTIKKIDRLNLIVLTHNKWSTREILPLINGSTIHCKGVNSVDITSTILTKSSCQTIKIQRSQKKTWKKKKQLANWQVKILTTTTPTYRKSFMTDSKIAIAAREPEAMVENSRVSVPLKSDQCNTI